MLKAIRIVKGSKKKKKTDTGNRWHFAHVLYTNVYTYIRKVRISTIWGANHCHIITDLLIKSPAVIIFRSDIQN